MSSEATALRGGHVLLITPFDRDGEIDERSLAEHIEFVLAGGVDGIVGLGTTGEFFTLSPRERMQLMTLIAERVGGRTTLTFGVGDSSTRVAIELARHARECGADVVMLQSPYYYAHSTAACDAHFLAVAAAVDLPVMLYDGAAGIEVSVERMRRLHEAAPNISYVKMSIPDPSKVAAVVAGAPGVSALCGDENMLVLALRQGAIGSTVGIGNVLPGAISSLHRAFERDDLAAARAVQIHELTPLVSVCTNEKSAYIRCFKEILMRMGIIASAATRLPLRPLDPLRLEEVLATVKALSGTSEDSTPRPAGSAGAPR
ncbi:MAG TPA: dihydrodipicolinate synthase family protein [Solirubrobacteraceae bacterium]|nr:dihydrodipicolinate synthase family protein [Solirubrobacteraceae bacterium]